MNKKIGEILAEHDAKDIILEDDIRAYSQQAMQDQYIQMQSMVAEGTKKYPYVNRNFYMVLVPLNERMMENKPKYWMGARLTPPTPAYKQIVFKYHYLSGELEYLWTIPSHKTYWNLWHNRAKYLQSDDPEEKRLCQFVVMMESGDLERWVQKENGEKPDGLIIMNKKDETAQG
jgi:hypothetical protein